MSDTPPSDRHDGPTAEGGAPARRPAWIAGAVLILVGAVFIVRNVAGLSMGNWWALFILIPAIGSLWTAGAMFMRNDRHFTAASRGPLVGGLVLLVVTAVLLFELDWGRVWPVFLIAIGAGSLLSAI
jgi:hypothetical protein